MLDDLFSSTRGPGLVGLLLAFVVLAGFTFFGMAVLDDRFNGDRASALAEKVEEQKGRIVFLEGRSRDLTADLETAEENRNVRAKLQTLGNRLDTITGRVEEKEDGVASLEGEIDELRTAHQDYRQRYRDVVRAKAVGTRIDELKTGSGKVYKDVVIKSIDALGLSFTNQSGPKRIAAADLPADLQDYYQFGEDEAANQRKKEQQAEALVASRIAKSKEQRKAEQEERQKSGQDAERARLEGKIAELERGIASARTRVETERREAARYHALHSQAMARGNISSHLAKARKAEEAAKSWQDAIDAAEKQIAELREMLR